MRCGSPARGDSEIKHQGVKIMVRALSPVIVAAILLGWGAAAHSQNTAACQSVQFSAEVLSRFPGAPKSCLDVISRDGQQYAVFKAQLEDVRGNSLRVRVKNQDGSYGERKTIQARSGRQVLIDGKTYPVSELAPNQEITAYVRVDRPLVALAPASESEPVDAEPLMESPPEDEPVRLSSAQTPTMPETASPLGVLPLAGAFCLLLALGLMIWRMRGE
jgi:hypothetical protein